MMHQPWLSVLIPTYNGEAYLSSALDSIVIQGDNEIECIVVDDGSTDSTLSIVNSYLDKIPLKLFRRERQGNWVANTNYALSLASADYICFLHQDDLWLQGRLSKMRSLLQQHREVNLFLHPSLFVDSIGEPLGMWRCPFPKYPEIITPSLAIARLLIQNFIAIPAPIVKREIALKVGGLDETLWYTADWDFWLKIAASGQTIYYPQFLAAFRVHGSSQTVMRSSDQAEFQQQMRSVVEQHLAKWETDVNRKLKIRQVALFSTEVNTALAAILHGEKTNLWKLGEDFFSLTPNDWYRYFRDSRIFERVWARLKARL